MVELKAYSVKLRKMVAKLRVAWFCMCSRR